jgi:hypothetical protein
MNLFIELEYRKEKCNTSDTNNLRCQMSSLKITTTLYRELLLIQKLMIIMIG